MAKVVKKSNYRLRVEPSVHAGWLRRKTAEEIAKEEKDLCVEMEEQIRRHVDNIGRIEVEYDEETVCSHCGYEWDVDENGVPSCCKEAINEYEASQKQQQPAAP
jgi:hypothetical protein